MVDKSAALISYREGKTLAEIGKQYGVSKQRINQIIRPTYTPTTYRNKHTAIRPNSSEKWVAKKLEALGFTVTHQPFMNCYDLLLNNTIRIEIKHFNGNTLYSKIGSIVNTNYDYLIVVVGNLDAPLSYIYPSSSVGKSLGIARYPKKITKHRRPFIEAWNLIA